MEGTREITFSEWNAVSRVAYEWAESYDTKDWKRLQAVLAPKVKADYSEVVGKVFDVSADEFIAIMSAPTALGNPLLASQHLLGASKWTVISDTEITGTHQIRAAHQLYEDSEKKTVKSRKHDHSVITHRYCLVDGKWKLAGLHVTVHWVEYGDLTLGASDKH